MATKQTSKQKSDTTTTPDRNKTTVKDAEYIRIGKLVSEMYDTVHPSRHQLYLSSVIKGFLAGFAGVLGATIGVAIFLYILTVLETIPFIEDISQTLQSTIEGESSAP